MEQIEGVYKGPRGRGIILIGGGGGGIGRGNVRDHAEEVSSLLAVDWAERI